LEASCGALKSNRNKKNFTKLITCFFCFFVIKSFKSQDPDQQQKSTNMKNMQAHVFRHYPTFVTGTTELTSKGRLFSDFLNT
jgi:hypothetical protein